MFSFATLMENKALYIGRNNDCVSSRVVDKLSTLPRHPKETPRTPGVGGGTRDFWRLEICDSAYEARLLESLVSVFYAGA